MFILWLLIAISFSATSISNCQVISSPGEYVLVSNLNKAPSTTFDECILINTSNVVLNGNGYEINLISSSSSKGVGIKVGNGLENITLKNITISAVPQAHSAIMFLGKNSYVNIYNTSVSGKFVSFVKSLSYLNNSVIENISIYHINRFIPMMFNSIIKNININNLTGGFGGGKNLSIDNIYIHEASTLLDSKLLNTYINNLTIDTIGLSYFSLVRKAGINNVTIANFSLPTSQYLVEYDTVTSDPIYNFTLVNGKATLSPAPEAIFLFARGAIRTSIEHFRVINVSIDVLENRSAVDNFKFVELGGGIDTSVKNILVDNVSINVGLSTLGGLISIHSLPNSTSNISFRNINITTNSPFYLLLGYNSSITNSSFYNVNVYFNYSNGSLYLIFPMVTTPGLNFTNSLIDRIYYTNASVYLYIGNQSNISGNYIGNFDKIYLNRYYGISYVYNNVFNVTSLVNDLVGGQINFNISKTLGLNLVGGPYIGGNFWANPGGTGYSEICTDNDKDSICDMPYVINSTSNLVDYLPLTYPNEGVIVDCKNITSPGYYELIGNITWTPTYFGQICIDIRSDDVVLNGNGFTINSTNMSLQPIAIHSMGYSNISIFNITLKNHGKGIGFYNVTHIEVKDVIFENATTLSLYNFSYAYLHDNIFESTHAYFFSPIYNLFFSGALNNTLASFEIDHPTENITIYSLNMTNFSGFVVSGSSTHLSNVIFSDIEGHMLSHPVISFSLDNSDHNISNIYIENTAIDYSLMNLNSGGLLLNNITINNVSTNNNELLIVDNNRTILSNTIISNISLYDLVYPFRKNLIAIYGVGNHTFINISINNLDVYNVSYYPNSAFLVFIKSNLTVNNMRVINSSLGLFHIQSNNASNISINNVLYENSTIHYGGLVSILYNNKAPDNLILRNISGKNLLYVAGRVYDLKAPNHVLLENTFFENISSEISYGALLTVDPIATTFVVVKNLHATNINNLSIFSSPRGNKSTVFVFTNFSIINISLHDAELFRLPTGEVKTILINDGFFQNLKVLANSFLVAPTDALNVTLLKNLYIQNASFNNLFYLNANNFSFYNVTIDRINALRSRIQSGSNMLFEDIRVYNSTFEVEFFPVTYNVTWHNLVLIDSYNNFLLFSTNTTFSDVLVNGGSFYLIPYLNNTVFKNINVSNGVFKFIITQYRAVNNSFITNISSHNTTLNWQLFLGNNTLVKDVNISLFSLDQYLYPLLPPIYVSLMGVSNILISNVTLQKGTYLSRSYPTASILGLNISNTSNISANMSFVNLENASKNYNRSYPYVWIAVDGLVNTTNIYLTVSNSSLIVPYNLITFDALTNNVFNSDIFLEFYNNQIKPNKLLTIINSKNYTIFPDVLTIYLHNNIIYGYEDHKVLQGLDFLDYGNLQTWFNSSYTLGPSIIGGLYIGGNFWAGSSMDGYSIGCWDNNEDDVCDYPYYGDLNMVDHYPLTNSSYRRVDRGPPTITLNIYSYYWIESINGTFGNYTIVDDNQINYTEIYLNGNLLSNITMTSNVTFGNLTKNLSIGRYNVSIISYDIIGNMSEKSAVFEVIPKPIINISNISFTNNSTQFFNVQIIAPKVLEMMLFFNINNITYTVNATGNTSHTFLHSLISQDYYYNLSVNYTNATGFPTITPTYILYADVIAPNSVISSSKNYTSPVNYTLYFNATDDRNLSLIKIYVNGSVAHSLLVSDNNYSGDIVFSLGEGIYNFTLLVYDRVNNSFAKSQFIYVFDEPVISTNFPKYSNNSNASFIITINASDLLVSNVTLVINGSVYNALFSGNNTYQFNHTFTDSGIYPVNLTVNYPNAEGTYEMIDYIYVDLNAPEVFLTSPLNVTANKSNFTYILNASDDMNISYIEFYLNHTLINNISLSTPTYNDQFVFELDPGIYKVDVVVYDMLNNSNSTNSTVYLFPPPIISHTPIYNTTNENTSFNFTLDNWPELLVNFTLYINDVNYSYILSNTSISINYTFNESGIYTYYYTLSYVNSEGDLISNNYSIYVDLELPRGVIQPVLDLIANYTIINYTLNASDDMELSYGELYLNDSLIQNISIEAPTLTYNGSLNLRSGYYNLTLYVYDKMLQKSQYTEPFFIFYPPNVTTSYLLNNTSVCANISIEKDLLMNMSIYVFGKNDTREFNITNNSIYNVYECFNISHGDLFGYNGTAVNQTIFSVIYNTSYLNNITLNISSPINSSSSPVYHEFMIDTLLPTNVSCIYNVTSGNSTYYNNTSLLETPGIYNFTLLLPDGAYTFSLYCNHTLNNTIQVSYVVDNPINTPPRVRINSPSSGRYKNDKGLTFSVTGNDAESANLYCSYSGVGSGSFTLAVGSTYIFTKRLPPGNYTFEVSCGDGQGGSAEDSVSFEVVPYVKKNKTKKKDRPTHLPPPEPIFNNSTDVNISVTKNNSNATKLNMAPNISKNKTKLNITINKTKPKIINAKTAGSILSYNWIMSNTVPISIVGIGGILVFILWMFIVKIKLIDNKDGTTQIIVKNILDKPAPITLKIKDKVYRVDDSGVLLINERISKQDIKANRFIIWED